MFKLSSVKFHQNNFYKKEIIAYADANKQLKNNPEEVTT